jgi:RHS repeat-associated protein
VYDSAGRRNKIIDALNNQTVFSYNANGNQLTMLDANSHTTSFEYDKNNRRVKTIYHDSSFDQTEYDFLGRVKSKTDQAGKTTQFQYDKLGRLTKVIDALNHETVYTYDEVGSQLTQTDANNHTTSYEYDKLGRRTARTLPLGMFEVMTYNAVGNLSTRTDFNGKTTTYGYDNLNRLLSKTPDASLNEPTVSFTYTATGQRQSMTDASGTTTYSYDNRDRLSSKATPQGTLTYSYDTNSNVRTVRSSNTNGLSVDFAWDDLNRLASVTDNTNATRPGAGITTYSYDNVGNLSGYLYPNGVQSTYSYNTLNRLTNMTVAKGANSLASYAYTLGAAGNRTSVAELNGRSVTYGYDDLYRLTSETIASSPSNNGTIGYSYDNVGNRLTRTSTVAAIPAATHSYDNNDRLTSDTYDANGSTTTSNGNSYSYDFENRIIALNPGTPNAVTFAYDGDGNRVAKTANGVTTKFLVDTNNRTGYAQVVEEIVGGNVQRVYTHGHSLISQTQLISGSWTTSFYGYDGHGSVRCLTNSTGAVTDTYTFDAFGNLIASTGTTPNEYLYAGEQLDPNLGFYYLRARYMNPSFGRFQTLDAYEASPLDPPSLHKYLYASADPANRTDPTGLYSLTEQTLVSESYAKFRAEQLTIQRAAQVKAAVTAGLIIGGAGVTRNVFLALVIARGLHAGWDALKQQLKEELDKGWVYFVHGTTKTFADDINMNGVNEERSKEGYFGGQKRGSFHVLPLGEDPQFALQNAYLMAERHSLSSPDDYHVGMVGKLPMSEVNRLTAEGHLWQTTFSGGAYPEWVFDPGSYATLNGYNQLRWEILRFRKKE